MIGFSADPQTEWLNHPAPDRTMQLLRDFWFDDAKGTRWLAPKNSVIDGASIPQSLWSLVGSPYTGQYRRASIVHDVACVNAGSEDARRAADRMFYEACLAGGCTIREAMILYSGVRVGAQWSSPSTFAVEAKIMRPLEDKKLEADFQLVATDALAQGETSDPVQVERQVDQAMIHVAALSPAIE